jgi:hypothetical protein
MRHQFPWRRRQWWLGLIIFKTIRSGAIPMPMMSPSSAPTSLQHSCSHHNL